MDRGHDVHRNLHGHQPPVGTYKVTVQLEGFRKAEKSGFALTADGRITADFGMSVGGLTAVVLRRVSGRAAVNIFGCALRRLLLGSKHDG